MTTLLSTEFNKSKTDNPKVSYIKHNILFKILLKLAETAKFSVERLHFMAKFFVICYCLVIVVKVLLIEGRTIISKQVTYEDSDLI